MALFIEEFVRSIVDNRASLDRPPGTIGQLLAARLDALGTAKPLAQMASVFGREAPVELLAELSDMPRSAFEAEVERLTASDVMVRQESGDKANLVFRHALLADAAYGAMQQPRRRALHRHVAWILRRVNPGLAETAPDILGRHYAEAGETAEAASLYRAAAQAMLDSGASAEAEGHARRVLELCESLPEKAPVAAALMLLGEALSAVRGYADPAVQEVYERGAKLALELGTLRELLPALRGLTSYYQVRGPMARAYELGAQVLRVARMIDDPVVICLAEQRHGWCLMCMGRLAEAVAMMESAVRRYASMDAEQLQRAGQEERVLAQLAWLDWLIHGRETMHERAELAAKWVVGSRPVRAAYVLGMIAVAHQWAGDAAMVAHFAAQSGSIAREHGFAYWIAMADALSGWSLVTHDDIAGLAQLRQAVRDYDKTQGQVMLPYLLGLLAEAELRLGVRTAALAALDRADSVVAAIGAALYRAPLLRLRARLSEGADRADLLHRAQQVAVEQGATAFASAIGAERHGLESSDTR